MEILNRPIDRKDLVLESGLNIGLNESVMNTRIFEGDINETGWLPKAPSAQLTDHGFCKFSEIMEENARIVFTPVQHNNNLFTLEAMQSICRLQKTVHATFATSGHRTYLNMSYNELDQCGGVWSILDAVTSINNKTNCDQITEDDLLRLVELLKTCISYYKLGLLTDTCDNSKFKCQIKVPDNCFTNNTVVMEENARIVFTPVQHNNNLFTLEAMQSICRLQKTVHATFATSGHRTYLNMSYNELDQCGGVWSILDAVTSINNKTNCDQITEDDLLRLVELLKTCISYYKLGLLTDTCDNSKFKCQIKVPDNCFTNNTVVMEENARIVFTPVQHNNNLFTLEAMQSICRLQKTVHATFATSGHRTYLNMSYNELDQCGGVWSILDAVTSINNKTNCDQITEDDLLRLVELLKTCISYYKLGLLTDTCDNSKFKCQIKVPDNCFTNNTVVMSSQTDYPMFTPDHPMEKYEQIYKKTYNFEQEDIKVKLLPYVVVFGAIPNEHRSMWDPDSMSADTVTLDDTFDVSDPKSQQWLMEFCRDILKQPFVNNQYDVHCFIDVVKSHMQKPCSANPVRMVSDTCCNRMDFPYPKEDFKICVPIVCGIFMDCGGLITATFNKPTPYGPLYSGDNNTISAIAIVATSIYKDNTEYSPMEEFWTTANSWTSNQIKDAPAGMRHGWFITIGHYQVTFYAIQVGLAQGTLQSIGMSLVIGALVLFLTTRNALIAFLAILSVAGSIFATIGALILLGWHLDIIESILLSICVGLSVDFATHYGVAYRVAPVTDRQGRSEFALQTLGSAITAAAISTFMAGAMTMPAQILSYSQLGVFLMIIMSVSWLYAKFFFLSICRTFGPSNNTAHISLPGCGREDQLEPENTIKNNTSRNTYHTDVFAAAMYYQMCKAQRAVMCPE
ncbi:uncharacterized protein [Amphiura filiformis]|uniref:uncharacterized protein n=1 Tax=Amphiura filiformis TaxID=82378 RepID=UPI003B222AF5